MAMAFVRTLVRSTFPPPYTRGLRVILGAEEKLMEKGARIMEKLLEEKDTRIMEKDTLLEMMAEEAAHALSRYTAVLSNRVIIDTGLKSAFPDAKTFSLRYEQFSCSVFFENFKHPLDIELVQDLSHSCMLLACCLTAVLSIVVKMTLVYASVCWCCVSYIVSLSSHALIYCVMARLSCCRGGGECTNLLGAAVGGGVNAPTYWEPCRGPRRPPAAAKSQL